MLELILHWLTFLTNGVNAMQVLAAARAGYSRKSENTWLFAEDGSARWGGVLRGSSYLKVVQKVPKCDVTLILSIYNSDWSQRASSIILATSSPQVFSCYLYKVEVAKHAAVLHKSSIEAFLFSTFQM